MLEKLKPPQIFSGPKSSAVAKLGQPQSLETCSRNEAFERAAVLMGCYRQGDCADPEVFATGAVAVLSHYPAEIVRKVTDPHSGLPGRLKWFPTIYEIREACEIENSAAKRRDEQDARIKEQFAERDRLAAMDPAEKRRAFIGCEMKWINAEMGKADDGRPVAPVDIRGMEDGPVRDAIREKLDAGIAKLAAASAATPLRMSDATLATVAGRTPSYVAPEIKCEVGL